MPAMTPRDYRICAKPLVHNQETTAFVFVPLANPLPLKNYDNYFPYHSNSVREGLPKHKLLSGVLATRCAAISTKIFSVSMSPRGKFLSPRE
jgi:hypothetical protein